MIVGICAAVFCLIGSFYGFCVSRRNVWENVKQHYGIKEEEEEEEEERRRRRNGNADDQAKAMGWIELDSV